MQEIIQPPAFQRPTGKLVLDSSQLNLVDGALTQVELDEIPAGYTDGIEDIINFRIFTVY